MRFGFLLLVFLSACSVSGAQETGVEINSIYWSDGDSGYLNGKEIPFRLANIDAPETGGVGAAIGGAKCEAERRRGFEAKAFVVNLTKGSALSIDRKYGLDKYDRLVIDLSSDGISVGSAGVDAGLLKEWPHKGRRQLVRKPDWCDRD